MRTAVSHLNRVLSSMALGAALLATGCERMMVNDWDPCASRPCAPPPCAPPVAVPCGNCGPLPAGAQACDHWVCVYVPPVYETKTTRVCVIAETCKKEWVPPVTETRPKQVCVREACSRQVPVPAEYTTVEECVTVAPARTEWQRITCSPEQLAAGEKQGDCWALVEIPAQTAKQTKQVCVRPATTRTESTPAEYQTTSECVEAKPGYWRDIPVPAQYEDKCEQICTSQGRWEWRKQP